MQLICDRGIEDLALAFPGISSGSVRCLYFYYIALDICINLVDGGDVEKKRAKSRRKYMKDYRQNYGDLMRKQISDWFSGHPEYLEKYCKKWRERHLGYFKRWRRQNRSAYVDYQRRWRAQHREKLKAYMRDYMRRYRNGEPQVSIDAQVTRD